MAYEIKRLQCVVETGDKTFSCYSPGPFVWLRECDVQEPVIREEEKKVVGVKNVEMKS